MGERLLLVLVVPLVLGYLIVTPVVGQQLDVEDLPSLDSVNQTHVSDWMDRCEAIAGDEALKDIKNSIQELMTCLQKHIIMDKLQKEVNVSIARGELDLVFKKYCKKRDKIVGCAEEAFTKLGRCTSEQEEEDIDTVRKVINVGIDFVCHNDGDRIALFMAEKGEECLKNHTQNIQNCIEDKIPEIKRSKSNIQSIDIAAFTINEQRCKEFDIMKECVVKHTSKCDDETPANLLGSLIAQMIKVMPCSQTSSASTFLSHTQHLLPHLLTLLAAALTAANILL